MMTPIFGWGEEFTSPKQEEALEHYGQEIMQGGAASNTNPHFKPVNIVADNGFHYVSIYVCHTPDEAPLTQQLALWFASLKETDIVRLSVFSILYEVNLGELIHLMSAIQSTKATIEMTLDHIVFDSLGYFYLLADRVTKGSQGALLLPSYLDQRGEDFSGPKRAIFDFFKWIVDQAAEKQFLTQEEAQSIHKGNHVILPEDRF